MAKHPFEQFNLESSLIDAVKDLNFEKTNWNSESNYSKNTKENKFNWSISNGYMWKSHAFLLPLMQLIDSEIKNHKQS